MAIDLTSLLLSGTWLLITLVAYTVSSGVFRIMKGSPVFHPLPLTALLVGLCLVVSELPVEAYQQHAQLLQWLLGPATVALAIPLYKQFHQIRDEGVQLFLPIVVGGVVAAGAAAGVLALFDVPDLIVKSMLTKSITTPLAMETSQLVGGASSLAAVFVIITGILGAVCAGGMFKLINIADPKVQGVALGTVAHAVGTSRAVHLGESASAYATVALCINGILTAIILPILFST